MQAPGVLEEEAEVLGHRIVVAEDVRQGRPIRAGRMRSLEGLVELLGIAEKDDRVRRSGHGKRVRKRHLAGLVNEQHVDDPRASIRCPEPGRSGSEVVRTGRQPGLHLVVLRLDGDAWIVEWRRPGR